MRYLCGFMGLKGMSAHLQTMHLDLPIILAILALQTAGIYIMFKAPRFIRWYMIAFSVLCMLRLPS